MSVHLLYDFCGERFEGVKVDVVLLAFLAIDSLARPGLQRYDPRPSLESQNSYLMETAHHLQITEAILEQPNWTIEAVEKKEKSSRGISDCYIQAHQTAQRQIDKIPLH